MKKREVKNIWFVGSVLLLILVSVFCVSKTVKSVCGVDQTAVERYYQEKEDEFSGKVRSFLEENGYRNSGIMMTRVVDGDVREYKMTIHHRKIDRMENEEMQDLKKELQEISFPADMGCIEYDFLLQVVN